MPQDDIEAAAWYRRAADQGFARGQYKLGLMHFTGRGGVPLDAVQAAAWLRKAADQGHATAQSALGVLNGAGRGGVPKGRRG